jgi:Tol biopolymer transport system component
MAKRPEDRYSSTRDLANDLSDIRSHLAELEAPPLPRRSRHWPLTGGLVIAVLLVAVTSLWRPPSRAPAIRFTLDAPPGTTFNVEGSSPAPAAVSPDGRLLVFGARDASGQSLLWVRPLDTTESRPLPGTDNATYPFWAPDGQSIGFFAGGQLKRLAATGGPPQVLCAAPDGRGGTWNREGTIVFAPDSEGPLYRVDAGGGPTIPVTTSGTGRPDASHRWPQFLPDGRHFLYTLWNADNQAIRGAVHLGSLDSLEGSLLIPNAIGGTYAPPGYVLFARAAGNLMALPFDARRLRTRGEPAALAANVHMHRYRWNAEFTVSSNGVLAYRARPASISQLTWLDRTGRRLGTVGAVGDYGGIRLSPDERRCAVELRDEGSGTVDIWAVDLAQGIPTRLTSGPFSNDSPIWSPDGTRVVFVSNRKGRWDLYQTALSGGGPAELLLETDSDKVPLDWSARARSIVFTRVGPASTDKWEVWVFRPEDGRQEPFLQTGANTPEARLSPDTRWMAYSSDETGAREVYLISFPGRESRRRVSPRGGSQPVWRRDGRQLFYVADDGALMAVDVPADARSTAGAAHVLFQPGLTASPSDVALYDVASDGQRFLVNTELTGRRAAPLTVVVNWAAAIER